MAVPAADAFELLRTTVREYVAGSNRGGRDECLEVVEGDRERALGVVRRSGEALRANQRLAREGARWAARWHRDVARVWQVRDRPEPLVGMLLREVSIRNAEFRVECFRGELFQRGRLRFPAEATHTGGAEVLHRWVQRVWRVVHDLQFDSPIGDAMNAVDSEVLPREDLLVRDRID